MNIMSFIRCLHLFIVRWFISSRCGLQILFLTFTLLIIHAPTVPIKIVKEPASYGFFGNNLAENDNQDYLVTRIKPANFSGPSQLRRLVGKCYNLTLDQYRYILCPFQNMTQFELTPRWNAYQGVLGVWDRWKIEANKFTAMVFTHGDLCGDTDRTVEVTLHCDTKEELVNVTEPKKCQYHANFSTTLVCHRDAVLVYPRLPNDLKQAWRMLESELRDGYITEKGYNLSLTEIFKKAGLQRFHSPLPSGATTPAATEKNALVEDPFNHLTECNKAYKDLKKEIDDLKKELETLKLLLDISNIKGGSDQKT